MGGKSSPAPPAPPDYTQTAELQGELNEQTLANQTWANRPTQYSPWGYTDWSATPTTDPATGETVNRWSQYQVLDPNLKSSLDSQMGIGSTRAHYASGYLPRIGDALANPVDYDQFRGVTDVGDSSAIREQAENAAYLRQTNRLDPQWNQDAQAMEVKLRNQGLTPGDEAYDRAMGNFDRARNDAYEQARLGSTAEGRVEAGQMYDQQMGQQAQSAALRQQEILEELQRRATPLDEQNMLLAGQGVQPAPQAGYSTAGMAQPANMMGAQQANYNAAADVYNAQQAQSQAANQGWMNLAGAGIGALGMFSDRRLKTDIRRIGTWRGYPFYAYRYVWGMPGFGVMADEVNQDAVSTVNGYAVVDYARVR